MKKEMHEGWFGSLRAWSENLGLRTGKPPRHCTSSSRIYLHSKPVLNRRYPDVRFRYQNRNLRLPLCSEEGQHLEGQPEYCTLEAFVKRAAELTPKNWEEECAVIVPS
jgi:hypothetical protein